jgi:hypothetical protein
MASIGAIERLRAHFGPEATVVADLHDFSACTLRSFA